MNDSQDSANNLVHNGDPNAFTSEHKKPIHYKRVIIVLNRLIHAER